MKILKIDCLIPNNEKFFKSPQPPLKVVLTFHTKDNMIVKKNISIKLKISMAVQESLPQGSEHLLVATDPKQCMEAHQEQSASDPQ